MQSKIEKLENEVATSKSTVDAFEEKFKNLEKLHNTRALEAKLVQGWQTWILNDLYKQVTKIEMLTKYSMPSVVRLMALENNFDETKAIATVANRFHMSQESSKFF